MFNLTRRIVVCLVCSATIGIWHVPAQGEDRTYDGTGNNLLNEDWGATGQEFSRVAPPSYADGISIPVTNLPSARHISNVIGNQTEFLGNDRMLSGFVYSFGQFINHDMERTAPGSELFAITTSANDPQFRGRALPFPRDLAASGSGAGTGRPREQVNLNTSYLDASMVYGWDANRAMRLRVATPEGPGADLLTGANNLLPRNTLGLSNDDGGSGLPQSSFFVAGDPRVNENVGLSSLHTLFMREHNRLVDELAAEHPTWSQEDLYQRARKTVGAELQVITYQEFLPALLGPHALSPHGQNDATLDATTINEFASALFRVGHSMLPQNFRRINEDGTPAPRDPVLVGNDAFVTSSYLRTSEEFQYHLRGLSVEPQEEVDPMVIDGLRNVVIPGIIDLDLFAGDIQRGRDHGLAGYNNMRAAYGLPMLASFADLTGDIELQSKLEELYGDVDAMDVFVGALAEDHLPGASVGPLTAAVLNEQFRRLRDGDRFWYENDSAFTADQIEALQATRLSDIIRRNTTIERLQDNVFFVPPVGDYNGNGLVEQADLDLVLLNWGADGTVPPDGWNRGLPQGPIDQGELDGVLLNWGVSAGSAAVAAGVPEPRTLLLAAIGLLVALGRSRMHTG